MIWKKGTGVNPERFMPVLFLDYYLKELLFERLMLWEPMMPDMDEAAEKWDC